MWYLTSNTVSKHDIVEGLSIQPDVDKKTICYFESQMDLVFFHRATVNFKYLLKLNSDMPMVKWLMF